MTFMLHCFVYEHGMCIHREEVAGSNEKTVDEGLLVMEYSRCTYVNNINNYVAMYVVRLLLTCILCI